MVCQLTSGSRRFRFFPFAGNQFLSLLHIDSYNHQIEKGRKSVRLNNLRIGARLALGFSLVLLLMLVMIGLSLKYISSIQQNLEQVQLLNSQQIHEA
ncbi:MAG: hypothetical protein ACM3O9_08170, partial [Methylocystaceae bacterium]